MNVGDQAKTLQLVLDAVCKVVDQDGTCVRSAAVGRVRRQTGLALDTVRKHFRALQALGVIEAYKGRAPESFNHRRPFAEDLIRLVKPKAIIERRNGFLAAVDPPSN